MPTLADMFPNLAKLKKDDGRAEQGADAREPLRTERDRGGERRGGRERADSRAGGERSLRLPAPRLGARGGDATLKVSGPTRGRRSRRRAEAGADGLLDLMAQEQRGDDGPGAEGPADAATVDAAGVEASAVEGAAVEGNAVGEGAVDETAVGETAVEQGAAHDDPVEDVIAEDVAPAPSVERRRAGERRSGADPRAGRERRYGVEARSGSDRRSGDDERDGADPRSGRDRRRRESRSEGFSPLASAARFGMRKLSGGRRAGADAGSGAEATEVADAGASSAADERMAAPAADGAPEAAAAGIAVEAPLRRRSRFGGGAGGGERRRSLRSMKDVKVGLPRRSGKSATLVGLDIQPGYVAAVEADVNGVVAVKRALGLALPPDTMREGDLLDPTLLADGLRELFARGHFGKRVRVGLANQRVVVRTMELPPIEDRKELAAAVSFSAQDQIPMPLANAVLDFQPLGIVQTPAGRRQRVIVVAAQREMVERLVGAVTAAGLRPEAVDLSAFAMIRALHRPEDDATEVLQDGAPEAGGGAGAPARPRTLFLNVGGLTNLAIADGTTCRFTRAVGGGLESMAGALAERRSVPLVDARSTIADFDLTAREPRDSGLPGGGAGEPAGGLPPTVAANAGGRGAGRGPEAPPELPGGEGLGDPTGASPAGGPSAQPRSANAEVRAVIGSGLREIAGEVRNSLEYHRAQEGGGTVERVVVSGAALEINGFASALEAELGFRLERRSVASARGGELNGTRAERLAVAAGLAVEELGR